MGKRAATGRGKKSGGGHHNNKNASKRTRSNSKEQRKARLCTIRFNSRKIQNRIRKRARILINDSK